ncbi:MAG: putative porin, partial [Bacteroidota bacterium]
MERILLFIVLIVGLPLIVQAQIPNTIGGPSRTASPQQADYPSRDTSDILYYYANSPYQKSLINDTLLDINSVQYDPVRLRLFEYAHLGHLGSAHYPILHGTIRRNGFDIGYHQYDLYQISIDQVPFFEITRPFVKLGYFQGAEQSNGYITTQFGSNFEQGVTLSIDYRNMNQIGTQTKFINQDVNNTAIAVGLTINKNSDKYNGYLSLASNTIRQEENGGIDSPPTDVQGFTTPSSATVFLDDAQTRHALRSFRYTHYLSLRKQPKPELLPEERPTTIPDSLSMQLFPDALLSTKTEAPLDSLEDQALKEKSKVRRDYTVGHQITYSTNRFKFFDQSSTLDSNIYNDIFLVDPRGLRTQTKYNALRNSFFLSTFQKSKDQLIEPNSVKLGVTHQITNINFEGADSTVNTLFLNGDFNFNFNQRVTLEANAQLGLLDHVGDYQINGKLAFSLPKLGTLNLELFNQLNTPNLVQSVFYLNEEKIWSNNFKKTLTTSLK